MDFLLLFILMFLIIFSVIFCAIRGPKRCNIKLIFVVGSAILSLVLAKIIAGSISVSFGELDPAVLELFGASSILSGLLEKLPSMCFGVLVYILLFILINLICIIPVSIINKKNPRENHGLGALYGIAMGFIVFVLMFAPLANIDEIAVKALKAIPQEVVSEYIEKEGIDQNQASILFDYAKKDGFTKLINVVGKPMNHYLTGAKVEGRYISLTKEADNLVSLVPIAVKAATSKGDIKELVPSVPVVFETLEKSDFILPALTQVLKTAASKWNNNEVFFGLDPAKVSGAEKIFVSYICSNAENISAEGLQELLNALGDLAEVVPEIDESFDITSLLQSDKSDEFISKVRSSEEATKVVDGLINTVIAENIGEPILDDKEALSELANVLNEVNGKEDSEKLLKDTLKGVGIDISDTMAEFAKEYIERNFNGTSWNADSLKDAISKMK